MPSDARDRDDAMFDDFGDFYKSGRAGAGQPGGNQAQREDDDPLNDFSAAGPLTDEGFQDDFTGPAARPPQSGGDGGYEGDGVQDDDFGDDGFGSSGLRGDGYQHDFTEAVPSAAGSVAAARPVGGPGYGVDDPEGGEDLFATLDTVMNEQMVGDAGSGLDDDDEDFDVDYDDEESEVSRNVMPIIVALLAVIAFGGVLYYAYTEDMLSGLMASDEGPPMEREVPVVSAPSEPLRERPDDQLGLVVPGQQNEALNPDARRIETLLSNQKPEEPVDLGSMVRAGTGGPLGTMAVNDRAANDGTMGGRSAGGQTTPPSLFGTGDTGDLRPTSPVATIDPVIGAREVETPSFDTDPARQQPAQPRASLLSQSAPAAIAPEAAPRPEPVVAARETASAPSPAQVASPTSARPQTPSGPFRVQVASMSSQAAASREWQRLQGQARDLLGSLSVDVVRVEIPGRGTFYRVQAGGMRRSEANRLCNRLKNRNIGCLVVR